MRTNLVSKMDKEKKSKRRTYKDFNENYFRVLEHFISTSEPLVTLLPFREASSSRRDFYRFFESLSVQYNSGDSYADMLSDITRRIIVSIIPGKADQDEEVKFTVKLHPMEGFFKNDLKEELKNKYPMFIGGELDNKDTEGG